jgi:hypothetical protein
MTEGAAYKRGRAMPVTTAIGVMRATRMGVLIARQRAARVG